MFMGWSTLSMLTYSEHMLHSSSHTLSHVTRTAALMLLVALTGAACSAEADDAEADEKSSKTKDPKNTDTDTNADPEDDDDSAGGSGSGVHITGSFNGESLQIDCEPPSDLTIGNQFLHQTPAGLFELWQFRCRTEDQELAVWFDLTDPIAGETYEQPAAGDQFNIGLGSPYDIQPLGRLTANLSEMTLSVTEVDPETGRLVGSFRAAWSEDDSNDFGELDGTFDVTDW